VPELLNGVLLFAYSFGWLGFFGGNNLKIQQFYTKPAEELC
jgi:hypothetical protein